MRKAFLALAALLVMAGSAQAVKYSFVPDGGDEIVVNVSSPSSLTIEFGGNVMKLDYQTAFDHETGAAVLGMKFSANGHTHYYVMFVMGDGAVLVVDDRRAQGRRIE